MTDQRELDRMLRAFLDEGPDELADRVIDAALDEIDHTQQRRAWRMPRRFSTMNMYSRLGAAAVIGVLAVAGTLVLVQRGQPGVGGSGPTPSAGPSQTASPSPGPVADVTDVALVADLAAVISNPYDAAKVAALYAPNAAINEHTANLTSRGLDEIGARFRYLNTLDFKVVVTSAPIRQDDFVAHFAKFGDTSELSDRAVVVYELKDGKVLNQWVYSAFSSSAASSPTTVVDEALLASLAATASDFYDAAKVAALYAPNAMLFDKVANETSTGLEAIQAKYKEYAAGGFKVEITSAWIRQDNVVAHFAKFGNTSELSGRGLLVYELKDGKVQTQWVYPAS